MAAEGEAGHVVVAAVVGLPEVQQRGEIGRHDSPNTTPVTVSAVPGVPGVASTVRCGEFGLKYGPSVWSIVGASPSWHAGVMARGPFGPAATGSARASESYPKP